MHPRDHATLATLADATATWVAEAPSPETLALPWLASLWQHLTGAVAQPPNGSAPPLYWRAPWARINAGVAEAERVFGGRVAVHDRLARALLRVPRAAADAAARLALTRELAGGSAEDLLGEMEAALRLDPAGGRTVGHGHSPSVRVRTARLVPVDERLTRRWAGEGADARLAEVAGVLREQARDGKAERLEALFRVYAAPAGGFLEAARALAGEATPPEEATRPNPLRPVIEAWAALPAAGRPDLAPLLLGRLEADLGAERHSDADPPAFFAWLEAVYAVGGHAEVGELMERYATMYLGEPDARVAFIAEHHGGGGRPSETPEGRIRGFSSAIGDGLAVRALGLAALEQHVAFARAGALRVVRGQSSFGSADPLGRARRAWLEGVTGRLVAADDPAAAMVEEVRGQRPARRRRGLPLVRLGRPGCGRLGPPVAPPARGAGSWMRGRTAESRALAAGLDGLAAWLAERPATVGTVLTHAAVTDEPLAGTLARLQPFAEEVLATEAERLAEMAAALPPLEGSPADLPAASIALLEAVGAVRRDASLRRAEELLALQMLDTESFSASRLAQELPGVLLGLAVEDRDAKALDLLVHWEKLAARAGLDRGDRAGEVSTRLLRDENDQSAADHEAALRLGLAGLQEERLTPRVEEWLIGAVSSRLDALITARMLEPGDDPQRGRGFRAAAGRLDAVLGGLNPRLLLPGFLEEAENTYAGDGMEKLRAEVLDANPGSVEGDGTAAGVAAAVLRLAVTLEEPDRAAGRDERLEANASALRAVLGDVSLSRPLRLAIIAPGARPDGSRLPRRPWWTPRPGCSLPASKIPRWKSPRPPPSPCSRRSPGGTGGRRRGPTPRTSPGRTSRRRCGRKRRTPAPTASTSPGPRR